MTIGRHRAQGRTRRCTRIAVWLVGWIFVVGALSFVTATPATAEDYVPVSGAGSTWSQNAIDQWRRDVNQYGMRVNYSGTGSSDGRRQFLNTTVDFAASDIPFQFAPEDGSPPENPAAKGLTYAYMPVTAGGTVFMYNLTINGQRVTNLRLSGDNITKIFTGAIKNWNDPAIAADNPGLTLPAKKVVPVVRSDGSGSTAQFSIWMINQHPDLWNAYCHQTGRTACGQTSYYPTVSGMIAQAGDLGVAGYVSQAYADGAIGYVNYSYALNAGFPVVKMLNAAGYYTEPTPSNVAVSLLKAQINTADPSAEDYLTQKLDGVYADADPRTYPLSSYSYMIMPTKVQGQFSEAKGKTLGAFLYYAMCQGQQQSASLGYSPMPINLVQAGFDQIKKIPGVVVQDITIQSCNNPTFSADGTNKLADTAPMPQDCDKQGPAQCATGTGGAAKLSTAVKPTASGGPTTTLVANGTSAGPTGAAPTRPGTATTIVRNTTATTVGQAPGVTVTPGDGGLQPTGAPVAQPCNADTGSCPATASGSTDQAVAVPLTLATSSGWTGTQTLMALAATLTLGLVLAPGLAWTALARRRR